MRLWPFVLVLVVAGLTGSPLNYASGHFYRWVDAQGQVHFSDQPHDNAQRLKLDLPNSAAAPPATTVDSAACKQDKARLARYRKATSITETNALGKAHVFTPAERQKLIARTQNSVNEACGKNTASVESSSPADGDSNQ